MLLGANVDCVDATFETIGDTLEEVAFNLAEDCFVEGVCTEEVVEEIVEGM